MNIKASLLTSFSIIIFVLLLAGTFLVLLQNYAESYYQTFATNIINEYQIGESASQLVGTYTSLLQNINDPTLLAQYQTNLEAIDAASSNLSGVVLSNESSATYQRLRNTISLLEGDISRGLTNVKAGDFSQSSNILEEVTNAEGNIKQDFSALIVSYVNGSEQEQEDLNNTESFARTIEVGTIFVIAVGIILLSIMLANRLSRPIVRLAELAEKTSMGGSLTVRVDEDLMENKNEVGSLARSFSHMMLDVEKRIEARTQEIQQERARLLASINSLPLGFFLVDITGAIQLSNRVAKDIFPQGSQTLASLSASFSPALDVDELDRLIKRKMNYEISETKFGEKSFRIMVTPVILQQPDESDKIIGSVLLTEDITEEKILERAKNQFILSTQHHLRTPLTIIKGYLQSLLLNPPQEFKDETKVMLEKVNAGADRLSSLVNELLDISQMQVGKDILKKERVDIKPMIEEILSDMSGELGKKRIAKSVDIQGVNLQLDPVRMKDAFTNLIDNAVKYCNEGGIIVVKGVNITKDSKPIYRLSIQDTGIGLTEQERGHVFTQYFERGEEAEKANKTGRGIGLVITKNIIEAHGGRIYVESGGRDKGSKFTVELPI